MSAIRGEIHLEECKPGYRASDGSRVSIALFPVRDRSLHASAGLNHKIVRERLRNCADLRAVSRLELLSSLAQVVFLGIIHLFVGDRWLLPSDSLSRKMNYLLFIGDLDKDDSSGNKTLVGKKNVIRRNIRGRGNKTQSVFNIRCIYIYVNNEEYNNNKFRVAQLQYFIFIASHV